MENSIARYAATNLAAPQSKMRGWTSISKLVRATAIWAVFVAALTVSSVSASNDIGLTECDAPGCAVATLAVVEGNANFQVTEVDLDSIWQAYVSDGSSAIGFTR